MLNQTTFRLINFTARVTYLLDVNLCTRAVAAGESERSGRWWWEEESKKECGLHVINSK